MATVDDVFLSVATAWEIAIKTGLGKLSMPLSVTEAMAQYELRPLTITFRHAEAVADLPLHHRDPFDRMLVAQAITEGLTLVTSDSVFAAYDVALLPA